MSFYHEGHEGHEVLKGNSELVNRVIGAAIDVHKALGPGLLESAYQQCLAHEFSLRGIDFQNEKPLPINYKGIQLDCGYRMDFVIEEQIVLELKSVDKLQGIHEAQLLTYLKLAGKQHSFLINFRENRDRFILSVPNDRFESAMNLLEILSQGPQSVLSSIPSDNDCASASGRTLPFDI